MASPEVIEPIFQKEDSDCGLAALAMLLGKPYREVSEVALSCFRGRVHEEGMDLRQMRVLARKFGVVLATTRLTKSSDLSEETGIISISKKVPHYAVIFEGIIIDPANALIYTPEAYLAFHPGAKFTSILKM